MFWKFGIRKRKTPLLRCLLEEFTPHTVFMHREFTHSDPCLWQDGCDCYSFASSGELAASLRERQEARAVRNGIMRSCTVYKGEARAYAGMRW